MLLRIIPAVVAVTFMALASGSAAAKSARCFTTDDGEYDCTFVATDADGSFEISASDKPKFSVVISEPGVAFVFGDYNDGGGNVALPGRHLRSQSDPACWVNEDTETQICAW
jgi:hypothetical protein